MAHSVSIRLSDGDYNLLQTLAVARDVSPTALAQSAVLDELHTVGASLAVPEPAPQVEPPLVPGDPTCIRASRHEDGVPCPICQAAA